MTLHEICVQEHQKIGERFNGAMNNALNNVKFALVGVALRAITLPAANSAYSDYAAIQSQQPLLLNTIEGLVYGIEFLALYHFRKYFPRIGQELSDPLSILFLTEGYTAYPLLAEYMQKLFN